MNDETRLAIDDAETPVNPYSLLAAVNASARSAGVAWLIFLGLMAYLLLALASITHRDLLLAGDVTLPLLQVRIGLIRFFLLVPVLFVLLHVGLLGKLALLARKTLEFDAAVRLLESTDQRSHPLRLELDNVFLVQVIAGPDRSRVVSAFLNGLSWLTLVIFPLALLLYVQVAFLPFHDSAVTLVHRVAVLADVVLLLLMGVFLVRPDVTYFGAFWRTAVHNPGSFAFGLGVLLATAFVAAVATVPGDTHRDSRLGFLIGPDGALFGAFPRNLHVTDAALADGRDIASDGRSINLRGRDLRSARLDRIGLQRADLTGANLDGASLAGADLRRVRLACDDRTDLRPSENRRSAPCASARGASFAKARLASAQMSGLDMRGARFEAAQLEGANLGNALMTGVDFSRADLQRADLSGGATLQGANFEQANLQGADLSGASLQMADFTGAALQGATLALANLEGAVLRDAALEGAGLQGAKLFGADLRGARLHFADMSKALVWRTLPPGSDSALSTDMAGMAVSPPSEEDMARMKSAVEGLEAGPAKVRLAGLMAPLSDAGPNGTSSGSPEALAWNSLARVSEAGMADGYRARITEQLARLICRARFGDGAVAAGIARRAGAPGFKGDAAALYDRVKGPDCPASATIPPQTIRDLAAAADAGRGQQ
jgi:uncharacterized protein YjbI with pentapeptide repeats